MAVTKEQEYEALSKQIKIELTSLVENLNKHKKDFQENPTWAFDELRTVVNELQSLNEIFGV